MLGARGVALGLGRVNLNDLKGLSTSQTRQSAAARAMAQKKSKDKAPKVIIKKHVDRQTLWAACRAVLFGTVLIALGATMATIGYYAEQLATLSSSANGTVVDEARKLQFASLSYVGPVVMGVGAFILMIACVMTLESRDKHAQVIREYPREERLSRVASGKFGKRAANSEEEKPLNSQQAEMQQEDNNNNNHAGDQSKNEKVPPNSSNGENRTLPPPPSNGGGPPEKSRKLLRDDSKSNSRNPAETDSFPCSTTTTTLTLSRSVRDSDMGKFPSTSCIDSLMKKADTRALLQRFLEDQSKMVNQLQGNQKSGSLKKQSKSLEIPGSEKVQISHRNVRSEEMPVRHSIVAEIHPPPLNFPQESPISAILPPKKLTSPPRRAPLVRAESTEHLEPEEHCSPMSLCSETHNGTAEGKQRTVVTARNSDTSASSFVSIKSCQSGVILTGHPGNNNANNLSPLTMDSEFHSLSCSVATVQETAGECVNGNSIPRLSPLGTATTYCPTNFSRARTEHWVNFRT